MSHEDSTPFTTATAMLSWLFAIKGHMESPAAIDPSADVVQGLRVDRDERLWRVGCAMAALRNLQEVRGDTLGALLLWCHLRPRTLVKEFQRKGVMVREWAEAVPLAELYREPAVAAFGPSRREAVRHYWDALKHIEEFAWANGWIASRIQRKARSPQVYRRSET